MHEAVGKTQTIRDAMDPARAVALHATLGLEGPPPAAGTPLPPFWHQVYFWQALPPPLLGQDGHPKRGQGLIPDLGLPQRMWAGGRLTFFAPLACGIGAARTTTVVSVETKQGRSGRLGFVTLRHDVRQGGELRVSEWQDIVYREPPGDRAARPEPPQARRDDIDRETRAFDPVTLFRYSALTFNGHRIHYDADYCRSVENYPGPVVHGPLLAQMLMLMAERAAGRLTGFAFRATAPLFAGERADFCRGADGALWVRGADGRQCMSATAE